MSVKKMSNVAVAYEMPTAIILADELVNYELREVFGNVETASLVVAGKTVIEHALLELQEMKVAQCIVLAGDNAGDIQKLINTEGRWGMTVTVMNYARTTEQVLREFKSLSEPSGLMVIEANCLRGFCMKTFLDKAFKSEYSLLEALVGAKRVGITLLKSTNADFIINAMPIAVSDVSINTLKTASAFHNANFDVMSGLFVGLEPNVRVNGQVGRRQHWMSNVSVGRSPDWVDVMIDKHCQIGGEVRMSSVILNHDVYIEKRAELDRTIVMPNSVISSSSHLSNAIVHNGAVFEL